MKLRRRSNGQDAKDQQRNQDHLQNIGARMDADEIDSNYIQEVTESDLNDGTADILANMLSKEWVLSNMSEAETHEAKWLARTMIDELEAMHPPEDSVWKGTYRAYAFDDPKQDLEPLNEAQKLEIFELAQAFVARVARSRDGFQQQILKTQIRRSEREDLSDDEGGWL